MSDQDNTAPASERPHSHAHAHAHVHGHNHGHDYAAENQKHYDATAQEYDARPDVQALAHRVRGAMLKAYPTLFSEDSTTVMDYACGTGKKYSPVGIHIGCTIRALRCRISGIEPVREVHCGHRH